MSTKLHDLETQAVISNSVAPITATADQTGSAVDLLPGDGNAFAVLSIGVVASGTTVTGKLQESDAASGGTWTDISGANFTAVTASNKSEVISFQRSQRYVRAVLTLAGGSPSAVVAVIIGQQRKLS